MYRLLLAAVSMAGLLSGPNTAFAADSLRVMAPLWSGFAPMVVAKDLGYYEEQGLDVDVRWEDDRSNVMAAMMRGDIDVEVRALSEYQGTPRVAATPGIIIGAIDVSTGGDSVVADGSIKTVEDLRGKTVAKLPALPSLLLLELVMKDKGVGRDEVKFVDSEVADTVAVFADPQIAAVASAEPFVSQAIANNPARNAHILVSSADFPGYVTDVFIARNEDFAASPDKYRRFLTAVHKAVAFYDKNPERFIELAAPHFQLDAKSFGESIKGTLDYLSLEEARKLMGTAEQPGELYNIFDVLMDLNLDTNSATEKLVARQKIDPSVLLQVKAEDVVVE
ncbi:MAG: ABC transporter substrate-binding protein [Rhizobiaceae bacterium]|jgi:NitT/TauT family transport system substrate-binding protein